MRERLVSLSHAMRIFTLLHSRASLLDRVQQLTGFEHAGDGLDMVGERLVVVHHAEIPEDPAEEARIDQMENRVLDATRILVNWCPVGRSIIQHRRIAIRACVTCEIPRRLDKRVEGIRLAARILADIAPALPELPVAGRGRNPVPRNNYSKIFRRLRELEAGCSNAHIFLRFR